MILKLKMRWMATFPAHMCNLQNPIQLSSEDLSIDENRPREFFLASKSPEWQSFNSLHF